MQLTRDRSNDHLIHAWESGRLLVGSEWIRGHLIVAADQVIKDWAVIDPRELAMDQLADAIKLEPEIILLGTGTEMLLPDTTLIAALAAEAIALEIMSTPAACRTFNVLVYEHRRVVAALFSPSAPLSSE